MSDIVRSHCEMLLPEPQRLAFSARLADHLATVLSKHSKFDNLVARLDTLALPDLLALCLVANDGVVLFATQGVGELSARFVPITEDTCPSQSPTDELRAEMDVFERELAAISLSTDAPDAPSHADPTATPLTPPAHH